MQVLAVLLVGLTLAQGQSLSSAGTKEIDALFDRAIQQGVVPGVVAIVVSKDQVLNHNALGLQDVANRKPMQALGRNLKK